MINLYQDHYDFKNIISLVQNNHHHHHSSSPWWSNLHYSGLLVHRRMGPKFTSRLALSHRLLPCLWGQWCTLNVINITITITIVIIGIIISMAKIAGTILCKDDRGVWGQDGDQKVIVSYILFLRGVNYSYRNVRRPKIRNQKKEIAIFFSSGSAVLGTGADTVSTSNDQEIFRWIFGINFK